MNFIYICGKARSGKDKTAEILKNLFEEDGKRVLIVHFADYLKSVCKKYFGWNGEKDSYGRSLLQNVGTKFRNYCKTFWIDNLKEFLKAVQNDYDYVIIPDCRYENEMFCMDEISDGYDASLRIVYDESKNDLSEEQRNHPSERELDGFDVDYEIDNNERTPEALTEKVKRFKKYLENI